MNNDRRNRLQEVRESLDDVISQIEEIKDEEQEALDNMPEGLQQTERGDRMQTAIDTMDEAISAIEDVQQTIDEAAPVKKPYRKILYGFPFLFPVVSNAKNDIGIYGEFDIHSARDLECRFALTCKVFVYARRTYT